MRRVHIYTIIAALFLAVACGRGKGVEAVMPKFQEYTLNIEKLPAYAVNIRYQHIVNSYESDVLHNIESENYRRSFEGYAVDPMDIEASAMSLAKEYIDGGTLMSDGGAEGYRYTMDQSVDFVRDQTILCFETYVEVYTGGMHEGFSLWYECFDLATGYLYDFAYLFDGEWGEAMRSLILDHLRAEESKLFIADAEALPMANSVLITDHGLTLIYHPDSVAPHEAGIISLQLTDEDIASTGAPLVWIEEAI